MTNPSTSPAPHRDPIDLGETTAPGTRDTDQTPKPMKEY
jgi:hypothetical protein